MSNYAEKSKDFEDIKMPNKKLTDGEIIKLLGCCGDSVIAKFALDLINRQKAKIESLIKLNKLESEIVADKGKDIERLKAEKSKLHKLTPKMIKTAKAEAYKECIEKVKEEYADLMEFGYADISVDGLFKKLDNLLKESVGEDK